MHLDLNPLPALLLSTILYGPLAAAIPGLPRSLNLGSQFSDFMHSQMSSFVDSHPTLGARWSDFIESQPGLVPMGIKLMDPMASYLPYMPYGNCAALARYIYNYDNTAEIDMWHDRICSTGCKPTLNEYQSKARALALPIIENEAKTIGTPELTDLYVTMMDRGHQWAVDECAAKIYPDGELCSSRENTEKLSECMRENGYKFVLGNLNTLFQALSDGNCKKHLDYFSSPDYLLKTIPGYFDHFKEQMC